MEKLRYHKGITLDEEIYIIDFGYLQLPTEHIRFYGDTRKILEELSKMEKNLFLFFLDQMYTNNSVNTSTKMLKVFYDVTKEIIGLSTYKNSISKFKRLKLLLPDTRGFMFINPIYFHKGFSKDRDKLIKHLLSATKEFKALFTEEDLII